MAGKPLTVICYVVKGTQKRRLDELSYNEQIKLAQRLNRTAMEAAGYTEAVKPASKIKKCD